MVQEEYQDKEEQEAMVQEEHQDEEEQEAMVQEEHQDEEEPRQRRRQGPSQAPHKGTVYRYCIVFYTVEGGKSKLRCSI